MRRKILVSLSPDAYRALALRAAEDERAVDQQASFMLKRAVLSGNEPQESHSVSSTEASR